MTAPVDLWPLFPRELTLQKGDVVYIHRQVDANWYEGEHHGRAGIFPTSYVEVRVRVSVFALFTWWEIEWSYLLTLPLFRLSLSR